MKIQATKVIDFQNMLIIKMLKLSITGANFKVLLSC